MKLPGRTFALLRDKNFVVSDFLDLNYKRDFMELDKILHSNSIQMIE